MGKVALVTGATSGFGEAIARALASSGYDVIVTGRRWDRLKALKKEFEEEYGVSVQTLGFDIRDRHQCEAQIGSLPENFRAIDILVNNAGLAAGMEHIDNGDPGDWDAMIDTNVKGALYITRIVSASMAARGHGHIINIGSISGTSVYENGAVYCASKHAMHALSQGMRIDLLQHGIKVTEIRPGMAETEFSLVRFHGDDQKAHSIYKGVEPLTAEDVATTVIWAISQPPHVNIDEIVMTCTAQANNFYTYRKQ